MGREVGCPWPDFKDCVIVLPDKWTGEHAARRDKAVEASVHYGAITLTQFAISLALLDDWRGIPGLDRNPEKWDFNELPLEIIGWINIVVLGEFTECFEIPKVSSSQSGNGQTDKATTESPGDSAMIEPASES